MSNGFNSAIFSIFVIGTAAINTAGTAQAAEISIAGSRGNVAQRLNEINGQLAAGAATSVYIEIAGRPHALSAYEGDALRDIELVRYNEAEFTNDYFADVEPVPGVYTTLTTE